MASEDTSVDDGKIEAVIQAACDVLELRGDAHAAAAKPFKRIVRDYVSAKSIAHLYRPAKEQRRYMARLQERLESVNLHLLAIDPDYLIALDSWLYDGPHLRPDIVTLRDHLRRLEHDVAKLLATFKARRGPPVNMPLEEAVRELLPLLEETLGKPVHVAQNKHKGENPSMASPGARAISIVLRSVDPQLSETAIANMVERVRLQPKPTETNEQRLVELTSPLDLCLLPNRHEDLRD